MKTKKMPIVVLSVIAVVMLFFVLGITVGKGKTAKAEAATVTVTLGSGNWATESSGMISTVNPDFGGGVLSAGNYSGTAYMGTKAVDIIVNKQNTGSDTYRINFNISKVENYTEILGFYVKAGDVFVNADKTQSFTFAKNYYIAYAWNSSAKATEIATVTLGAGRWATAENRRINTNKTTWEGTVNGGNYYGNFYSENNEVYSDVYVTRNASSGKDGNFLLDLSALANAGDVLSFVVRKWEIFVNGDKTALWFDDDYYVTYNWGAAPKIAEIAVVTIGSGRVTWIEKGASSGTVQFNKSVWTAEIGTGYYYGKAYNLDGTEISGSDWYFWVTNSSGVDNNARFYMNTDVKEFVVKSANLYTKADKTYPIYFDCDYLITCNWGGIPAATPCDEFKMKTGASIRLGEVNGLRFTAEVSKRLVAGYTEEGYTVSAGTVILPEDYKDTYGDFTADNLFGEAYKDVALINLTADFVDDGDNYLVNGSIVDIKDGNLERKFVGRAYLKLEKDGKTRYVAACYDGYTVDGNSRTVMEIAEAAYNDENTASEAKEVLRNLYISKKK